MKHGQCTNYHKREMLIKIAESDLISKSFEVCILELLL